MLGPKGDFTSDEKNLLDEFPGDVARIDWHSEVSPGLAGVTVAEGRLYTVGISKGADLETRTNGTYLFTRLKYTGNVDVTVHCLDATSGTETWHYTITVPGSFPVTNWEANTPAKEAQAVLWGNYYGPKSAPTIDSGRVYAFTQDGTLLCLEAATGHPVWTQRVRVSLGGKTGRYGYAGAPLVVDDLVVVPAYADGGCLAAFHKDTGELAWQGGTMGDLALKQLRCDGYSSPVLARIGGQRQIVLFTGGGVQAVACETGKLLWNYPLAGGTREIAPTPVIQGDCVFVGSTYCPQDVLLRIEDGRPKEVWQNRQLMTQFGNVVCTQGCLFGSHGSYIASKFRCLDFAAGDTKWTTEFRADPEGDTKEHAFTLVADGKLLILTAFGELILARASTEAFKPLGRVHLGRAESTRKFWPSPALANGHFFCQNTGGEIWSVDLRK